MRTMSMRLDDYTNEVLKDFSDRSGYSKTDLLKYALLELYHNYGFNGDDVITKAECTYEHGKQYYDYKQLQKKVFK